MPRILTLLGLSLLFCSTAGALQGGGGESTKNPKPTPAQRPPSAPKPRVEPRIRSSTPTLTPTLAYKTLYEAVKKKDYEGIKKVMSKGMLDMWATWAAQQKKTLDKAIENGGTETTFSPSLPKTRNEKLWGNVAILEVQNEKTGAWDALPFVREEGDWKLALDTYFRGTMTPNGPTNTDNPGELPSKAQPGVP